MTNPRFDRAMPFGEHHPSYNGARYVQNGHHFSFQEEYLFSEGDEGAVKAALSEPVEPQADVSAFEGISGEDREELEELARWGRGELSLPFYRVKKMILKHFPNSVVTTKAECVKALRTNGVISSDGA